MLVVTDMFYQPVYVYRTVTLLIVQIRKFDTEVPSSYDDMNEHASFLHKETSNEYSTPPLALIVFLVNYRLDIQKTSRSELRRMLHLFNSNDDSRSRWTCAESDCHICYTIPIQEKPMLDLLLQIRYRSECREREQDERDVRAVVEVGSLNAGTEIRVSRPSHNGDNDVGEIEDVDDDHTQQLYGHLSVLTPVRVHAEATFLQEHA